MRELAYIQVANRGLFIGRFSHDPSEQDEAWLQIERQGDTTEIWMGRTCACYDRRVPASASRNLSTYGLALTSAVVLGVILFTLN